MALYNYNLPIMMYNFSQETVSFSIHENFIQMSVVTLETMHREAFETCKTATDCLNIKYRLDAR